MTPAEQQKAVSKLLLQMALTEAPGVLLIVAGLLGWRGARGHAHSGAMAPWEMACIAIGFLLIAFAVWRFFTTARALGLKPNSRTRQV